MNKVLMALCALVFAASAQAAPVAVCDPGDPTVPHRVVRINPSANTINWLGHNDAIIFNNQPVLPGPMPYVKCGGGDGVSTPYLQLEVFTQAEIDAWDAVHTPPNYFLKEVYAGAMGDQPTCNANRAGNLYVGRTPGDNPDRLFLCAKRGAGTFAWAEVSLILP